MKRDISIENASFSYGLGEENLLDKINLNIEKGKFIGILGPNGCGKSTLLKVILKYLNPKEGIIKIENKELKEYTQSELAEILSFVPQKSSLTMPLTVEDVVYMGRVPYMKNKWTGFDREDREKVEKIMQMLKIDKFKNRVIFSLSGGEFQRVHQEALYLYSGQVPLPEEPSGILLPTVKK